MKTLRAKFSVISGLLFSFLMLTSPFLMTTETYSAERVTESTKMSSDHLKANRMAKTAAAQTGFIENKGQVLEMEGQHASFVDFMLDRGSTQIFLLGEAGIAWQFKRVHYPDGYEELHSREGVEEGDFLGEMKQMNEQIRVETYRMDMVLEGADPNASISTEGKSTDYFNYYNAGALEVYHFEQVTYHDVYPGIDWVVYTNETGLKYDFIVHPGADPNQIKLKFRHHEELYLDDEGNLIHGNRMGSFTEFAPVSFQQGREVLTEFILQDDILQFELGEYNPHEPLTIDPARIWGTYYGDTDSDEGKSTATDGNDDVYLAGRTISLNNIASGGHQNTFGGGQNAFLVKFNPSGIRQWATYYGGTGMEFGENCATDLSNNVFLSGYTTSTNNIAFSGHQNTKGGGEFDGFLAKFNAAGVLQWGTYYGGEETDAAFGCTTDSDGNVYLVGATQSTSGIAVGGHQNIYGGGPRDAFLVKFNASGVRQWGTYCGGSDEDRGWYCATDASNNVYITGWTESTSGIAVGGHQNTYGGGGEDAFLVKYNSSGVRLWGTYYGGTSFERARSCATDASENVYIVGETASTSGISFNGHQNSKTGPQDAFMAKFNSNGVRLWGTYYGGSGTENGFSCIIDGGGNVYFAGGSNSVNNIASGGFQNTIGGSVDGFLAKFSASGVREWGTYYGGSDVDNGFGCAADSEDNVYLAGRTWSTNGIASGGHQNTYGGGIFDGFLAKFEGSLPSASCVHGFEYESLFAPTDSIPVTMSECNYAGEYNVISGVLLDKTYIFSSSESSDWLVLTDDSDNVLAEGTTPLSWLATFNGTVRLHVSTDADCGAEEECRETTIQCITCLEIANCIHPDAWGTGSAPTTPSPVIISSCVYAGEYNTINDIVSGQTYQFSSSISTDWLVLTDVANNLLSEGFSPISWTATFNGTVRLHISANPNCGPENECRVTTMVCTSCPTPVGCIHSTLFGGAPAPTDNAPLLITSCIYAGEYNAITDVVSGETYEFSSSIGTDWLVLTDDADNILVEGFSPISWTAGFSGTVRLHVSTDINCGTEIECRATSVQCTSCMSSPVTCCENPLPGPGCPQYPDCENAICAFDPFCCNTLWDAACAGSAISLCGVPECTPASCVSPTLTTHTTTDCVNGTYDVTLDIAGDGNAQFYDVFVGLPACDENQNSAGFPADLACESVICADDPFCCDNTWDGLCALAASSEPACAGCLAPQSNFIGTFAGGTTGIAIGTFPVDEDAEIIVLHDWDSSCDQTISTGPDDICGCTNANAVNFDPDADIDDGSCVFAMPNDDCANAQNLTVTSWPASTNTPGTLAGAFGSGWGACTGVDGPDVFYTFNVATPNHYFINLNAYGGFSGVVELYDTCSGTLLECFGPGNDCAVGQGSPGFPDDPGCEATVCVIDDFCCNNTWDGICGSIAADPVQVGSDCDACVGGLPAPTALAMNLPAGDYTIRVRNVDGQTILDSSGDFLIGVQSFPTAQVQANPANFLYACNTIDRQLEEIVGASPQTGQLAGIQDYEWEIHRVGGGFSNTWVRGEPNYAIKLTWLGMEYGETYNVYVRLLLDVPGVGPVWGVHQVLGGLNPEDAGASTCTIATSSSVTQTEVLPQYSPTNIQGDPYQMCNIVIAQNVAGAQNYEWEFDNGIDPVVYYLRGAGNPAVKLSWVNCLKPNHTYQVRVRAQVNGLWGTFGSAFALDMAPTANTALRANICGTTRTLTQWLLPNPVCIADSYEYQLTNTATNDVHTAISTNAAGSVQLNSFSPPLVPGAEYEVEVKATQCGEAGDYSATCNITIASPGAEIEEAVALRDLAETSATLYPNPNAGSEVRVELGGLGDGNHEVMIQIYNIYGKLIQTEGFGHAGSAMSRLIRFDGNMAMGMYMVQIVVDGERFATERLVVK